MAIVEYDVGTGGDYATPDALCTDYNAGTLPGYTVGDDVICNLLQDFDMSVGMTHSASTATSIKWRSKPSHNTKYMIRKTATNCRIIYVSASGVGPHVILEDIIFDGGLLPGGWTSDGIVWLAVATPFTAERCTFRNVVNTAHRPSVLSFYGSGTATANVKNCIFYYSHTTRDTASDAHGIVVSGTGAFTINIDNCTFDNCGNITPVNNTLLAAYRRMSGTCTINAYNNVMTNFTADGGTDDWSAYTVLNSSNNASDDAVSDILLPSSEPYVNRPNNDYTPKPGPGSLLINGGTDVSLPTDYFGRTRYGVPDIGAVEALSGVTRYRPLANPAGRRRLSLALVGRSA